MDMLRIFKNKLKTKQSKRRHNTKTKYKQPKIKQSPTKQIRTNKTIAQQNRKKHFLLR